MSEENLNVLNFVISSRTTLFSVGWLVTQTRRVVARQREREREIA